MINITYEILLHFTNKHKKKTGSIPNRNANPETTSIYIQTPLKSAQNDIVKKKKTYPNNLKPINDF